jgi:hypothetical protein
MMGESKSAGNRFEDESKVEHDSAVTSIYIITAGWS